MLTAEEYRECKARSARHEAMWAGRCAVASAEIAQWPADAQITNEERSEMELYEWLVDPPVRYFAYVKESTGQITTWMGDVLGAVSFGREWRDNFGGTRVPVSVRGSNGRRYHGTYYKSAGDYCRLAACKV